MKDDRVFKHMTLHWKELLVHWMTGLLLKIILKNWRNVLGEKKSAVQQGEARHLGRSYQQRPHKRGATTHTAVLQKQAIRCSGSWSENKPEMAWARQRVVGDISRNMLPENKSQGHSFSCSVLSKCSPHTSGKIWTSEESAEGSNRKNPSSRKEKKSWGIFSLKTK